MATITKAKYSVTLPGHHFPGDVALNFKSVAFLFNGGNSPTDSKLNDPEFAERVNSAIERIRNGEIVSHSCGLIWGVPEVSDGSY